MISLFANYCFAIPRPSPLRPATVAFLDREDTSRDVLKEVHPNGCCCVANGPGCQRQFPESVRLLSRWLQQPQCRLWRFREPLSFDRSLSVQPVLGHRLVVICHCNRLCGAASQSILLRGSWLCIRHGSIPYLEASPFRAIFQAVFCSFASPAFLLSGNAWGSWRQTST